jgi:polyisoprenoid-binding protein YceI
MTAQPTLTRDWQGLQVPPAGTYDIDPSHTTVEIIARHMIVAKVRGRFEQFSGRIQIAEDPSASTVDVEIEAGSINTAEEQRDAHLRSPDFLDVEGWPHLTFHGRDPEHVDGDRFRLTADLTVRDVTKPVEVGFTLEGVGQDPWGNTRAIFSGDLKIDREQFGMTWNQALETGGVLVGKELTAEIECQAVLQQ